MGTSKLDNETLRGIETLALDIARSAGFRDFATLDHESPADSASKVMRTTGSAMDGKGTQEPAKDAAGGDTVLRAFHNRAPKDCSESESSTPRWTGYGVPLRDVDIIQGLFAMESTTISFLVAFFGAWSFHGRPVVAGALLAIAALIATSSIWLGFLNQSV